LKVDALKMQEEEVARLKEEIARLKTENSMLSQTECDDLLSEKPLDLTRGHTIGCVLDFTKESASKSDEAVNASLLENLEQRRSLRYFW